jgi:aminoglycoside 3-N-acetyltransferase
MPLRRGDILFLHANIGFFGRAEGVTGSHQLCEMFFDALMDRVGNVGTIVVPTFTYSHPRNQVFNPKTTSSEMGIFAEWIRLHPDAKRSTDPNYSVAAIGQEAELLTNEVPENSFGRNCFFERFLSANGTVLNLNLDAGSTFLHFLERENNALYRFDKSFDGFNYSETNQIMKSKSTIYVRYIHEATLPNFENFHNLAKREKKLHCASLGRGAMNLISANNCQAVINSHYSKDPWMLTRASGNKMLQNIFLNDKKKLIDDEEKNA